MSKFNKILSRSAAMLIPLVAMACTGDNPQTAPQTSPDKLFWATQLNHRAITMAEGETLQLQVKAYNPLGVELPALANSVVYTTSDTARLYVSSTGLLTARDAGTGILIVARVYDPEFDITLSDTARVNIAAVGNTVSSFSIQPDSTKLAGDESESLVPKIYGNGGLADPITGVQIRYTSSNTVVMDVNALTGEMSAKTLGTAKIAATATIFGDVVTDTVEMIVTHAIWARVIWSNLTFNNPFTPMYLQPEHITVRKGATIRFQSSTPTQTAVNFSGPGAVTGGDIPAFASAFHERQFPVVGDYTFTLPGINMSGTIKVID